MCFHLRMAQHDQVLNLFLAESYTHTWPKEGSFSSGAHLGDTLVSRVKGLKDSCSEGWGNDYAVIVKDDTIKCGELIAKLVIRSQLSGQVRFRSREPILDFIYELNHARVTGRGRANVIP